MHLVVYVRYQEQWPGKEMDTDLAHVPLRRLVWDGRYLSYWQIFT